MKRRPYLSGHSRSRSRSGSASKAHSFVTSDDDDDDNVPVSSPPSSTRSTRRYDFRPIRPDHASLNHQNDSHNDNDDPNSGLEVRLEDTQMVAETSLPKHASPPPSSSIVPVHLRYDFSLAVHDPTTNNNNNKRNKNKKKFLLQHARGEAHPGDLVALCGPSGSGKTTLLSVLSGRLSTTTTTPPPPHVTTPTGTTTPTTTTTSTTNTTTTTTTSSSRSPWLDGTVLLNDQPQQHFHPRSRICFVPQDDLFVPSVTPREHLLFAATLRMDRDTSPTSDTGGTGSTSPTSRFSSTSPTGASTTTPPTTTTTTTGSRRRQQQRRRLLQDRLTRVQELLDELGLQSCADTPIGGDHALVQGRISGGEQKRLSLATELLNRPSMMLCDEVTSGLDSYMAESVVTQLKHLANQGRTIVASIHQPSSFVYKAFTHVHLLVNGRTAYFGTTDQAIRYFEQSLGRPLPAFTNPSDFFMKQLCSSTSTSTSTSSGSANDIVQVWEASEEASQLQLSASMISPRTRRQQQQKTKRTKHRYAASWWTQLGELMGRTMLAYRRDAAVGRLKLLQSIVMASLVGIIYVNIGKPPIAIEQVQSVSGALFYGIMTQALLGFGSAAVFPLEKPIFKREVASHTYCVSAYALAKFFAEGASQIVLPLVFCIIYYFLLGFGSLGAQAFFEFALFVILTYMAAIAHGYVVGSMADTVGNALALVPIMLMPLIIFGGFFVNVDNIQPWFVWISYLSMVRYGFEGVMIVVWDEEEELGEAVLDSFSFSSDHKWRNVGLLCVLVVGYRLVSLGILKLATRTTTTS